MKHTHFFGNADTVFQKEKRFCAFQINAESLKFRAANENEVKLKFKDVYKEVDAKNKREESASKAVKSEVQKAMTGMGRFSERVKANLMFKDQTKRIDDAAHAIAGNEAWFEARKAELGEDFDLQSAFALALQEARAEMETQVRELEEKQKKSQEALAKIRENLRWYQVGAGALLRMSEWKAGRAEKRAEKAKTILEAQTEKLETRFSNIESARRDFMDITGIEAEKLTRIIAGKEKENGRYLTLTDMIRSEAPELQKSLKKLARVLSSGEGMYFNRIQVAKGFLERIQNRKALDEKMKSVQIGEFLDIQTESGNIKYKIISTIGDNITLTPEHDSSTLPALIYNKKTQEIKTSVLLNSAQKVASKVGATINNAQDLVKSMSAAAKATKNVAENAANDNIKISEAA